MSATSRSSIILLHKKGSKMDPFNYRPILLLQITFKVLDKWISDIIHGFVDQYGGHYLNQYDFIKGKSCVQQFFNLVTIQEWCTRLRQKLFVAFIDIKKAYNSVPRTLVWQILNRLNVPTCIIRTLHRMYDKENIFIKIGDLVLDSFSTNRGLK